ncbi:MAG TPA: rhodanese-like domain-containing protein [Candidatus Binatia bacterium]|nr:rhodanese-like domain-containing protein [Candidatus Binatia bacterium]
MNPDTLAALMASDAPHAVLDLRERGAYQRGHIFRTTLLPRRELEFRLPALVPSPAVPIVLVDEDEALAALARPALAAMGYRDVRTLEGGLAAWRAAGRPIVQGVNVPSKVFGEQALHHWKTPEIAPGELAERIARRDDMVIVDSRTPEEYHRACVPGAISVPGGELVFRILDLVQRPEQTIVVHCGGRTRSYIGAESLRRMGLPNPIVALKNGTMGWDLAGLTLERGATRGTPAVSPRSRAAAALVAKRVAAEDGIRFVTPAELRDLLARRAERAVYLFDVRTREEYGAGHIAGAVWSPGGQTVQATDEYVAVRAGTIVLACDGFARATLTAAWLKRMGFPDVAALAGGLPAWTEAGGAVETGHPTAVPFGYEAARAAVPGVRPGDLGDALVIDVDTSDAYARGHVPGATWICRSRLETRIGAVAPDRARPIVVTCGDGRASTLAAATLRALGHDARVLEGGTRAWDAAGRPLESGATKLGDTADDVVRRPHDHGRSAMEAYLAWEEALDDKGVSPVNLLSWAKL